MRARIGLIDGSKMFPAEEQKDLLEVAREDLARTQSRVRELNDELADACTAEKVAKANLRKLQQAK